MNGQYRPLFVHQPLVVQDYNKFMGAVDKSDHLIGKYETLRKTNRWWKTLFFHFLDIARVNSYILFKDWAEKNPDIEELKRPKTYNQLDFTMELIREMGGVTDDQEVPLFQKKKPEPPPPPPIPSTHPIIPVWATEKRNCKLCYKNFKKERKIFTLCRTCNTYYCFTKERNCLLAAHE